MRSRAGGTVLARRAFRGIAPAAALAMALTVAPAPAPAQLSPGPLSEPHAHLEGVGKCLTCHAIGAESLDAQCLECHREIAWLMERERGFHGVQARGECAGCHPDHGGRDFVLIEWPGGSRDAFDHREAGWPLEGKHAQAKCEKCHRPELLRAEAVPLRPEGSDATTWIGLETACTACHEDFHKGRFGDDCTTCHTAADWKTIIEKSFDHARTAWPLRGAHADVKCATCHDAQLAWGKRPPHARCDDCHGDAHAGTATLAGAPVDCDACHSERWFRPSAYTASQHDRAPWKLEGRHVRVDCVKCHARAEGADAERRFGKARVDLRPASARCADCHADAHAGQLAKSPSKGDCAACHGVDGFRPARYAVADHAKLDFPLLGRHAEVECRACHGPERPGMPAMPSAAVVGAAGIDLHPGFARCADCHRDPHDGRFSRGGARPADSDCLACHDHRSFRRTPYDVAAHARSRFPLEGAHVAVACLDCHRELAQPRSASTLVLGPAGPVLAFAIEDRACAACHADPHAGQFAGRTGGDDCAACHGVDAFAPAVRFDHQTASAFPLDGTHAKVACGECHRPGNVGGTETVIWRPVPHRCQDCHANLPTVPNGEGSS